MRGGWLTQRLEYLAYTEEVAGSNPAPPRLGFGGAWPSGKASDFESENRRLESFCPKGYNPFFYIAN